jgi:hypothetical protein
MFRVFIIFILSILITFLSKDYILMLNFDDYQNVLESLLIVASIVIAIIGTWIAIIYPNAINKKFNGNRTDIAEIHLIYNEAEQLEHLVISLFLSAISLMIILMIQFVIPLLRIMNFKYNSPYIYYLNFLILCILILFQLNAVFGVIKGSFYLLIKLQKKNRQRSIDAMHNS